MQLRKLHKNIHHLGSTILISGERADLGGGVQKGKEMIDT